MPIKFTPTNETETKKYANLPPGTYPFTVLESGEVASKSVKNAGKIMVRLKLNVHGNYFDKHVYDYFADWFSEWKMKHFAETAGLGQHWLEGYLDARDNAWKDRTGYVEIDVETDQKFGEKNVVVDYRPNEAQKVEVKENAPISPEDVPAKPASKAAKPIEDDVPF